MDFRLAQNIMDEAVRGQHRAVFLPTAGSCKIPAVIEAAPDARAIHSFVATVHAFAAFSF
jgi:hypothetical protein